MGSARAPRGSPSHRETGHPAMACRAGKVRPGRGLRGKGCLPSRPPRPRTATARSPHLAREQGRAAFPARGATGTLLRSQSRLAGLGMGALSGIIRRGSGAREPGGATPHPIILRLPREGAASLQIPRPPTRRWQRGKMT